MIRRRVNLKSVEGECRGKEMDARERVKFRLGRLMEVIGGVINEMEGGKKVRHKQHMKLIIRRREERNERYTKEVKKAIKEDRERDVIKRERKRSGEVNKEVRMEEWTRHFKDLSGAWRKK